MIDRTKLDQLRARIPLLKAELRSAEEALRTGEARCTHSWGETTGTSEERNEPRQGAPVHRGSDMWYETTFVRVQVPIWTRTCRICGKQEQTDKLKELVTKVPSF